MKMRLTIEVDNAAGDARMWAAMDRMAGKRHRLELVSSQQPSDTVTPEQELAWLNSEFAAHAGF